MTAVPAGSQAEALLAKLAAEARQTTNDSDRDRVQRDIDYVLDQLNED